MMMKISSSRSLFKQTADGGPQTADSHFAGCGLIRASWVIIFSFSDAVDYQKIKSVLFYRSLFDNKDLLV